MKVLILAAGIGERLLEQTKTLPKALVKLNGRPLVDYVLDFVSRPDVDKIGIAGGHEFNKLKSHVSSFRKDIEFFYNHEYRAGSIKTLLSAFKFIDDTFLLMNVDHIYPHRLFNHILKNARGITIMADSDRNLAADDMKVQSKDGRYLLRIRKDLKEFDFGYIGLTYCSKESLDAYKRAAVDAEEIYGADTPVEWVLGHMAANGYKINILNTNGFRWLEVDTPDDLNRAEDILRKDPGVLL